MPKDSFVFHKEWRDAISGLSAEIRLEVYEAIIEYGISGTLTSGLRPMAMLAFNFAKAILDRDAEREKYIRHKRSEAGKKGGARIGNKNAVKNKQKQTKQTNQANACFEDIPPIPPIEDNIDDSNESLSTDVDVKASYAHDVAKELVVYFNALIDKYGSAISKLRVIQGDRKKLLMARIKQYGIDSVKEAFDKAARSRFLNGQGGRSFIASFDWIIKPNNFPKVLEGNYDNKDNNNGTTQTNQGLGQGSDHPTDEQLERNGGGLIAGLAEKRRNGETAFRK